MSSDASGSTAPTARNRGSDGEQGTKRAKALFERVMPVRSLAGDVPSTRFTHEGRITVLWFSIAASDGARRDD
jgi:hypothetical protein